MQDGRSSVLKSLTGVVPALQQIVELKTTILKISPRDFGQTSVSFSVNFLEDSKVFLSRLNKLILLHLWYELTTFGKLCFIAQVLEAWDFCCNATLNICHVYGYIINVYSLLIFTFSHVILVCFCGSIC